MYVVREDGRKCVRERRGETGGGREGRRENQKWKGGRERQRKRERGTLQ